MMKKGYLKSLSAAMLATVLVLSSAMCVAAEETGDTANQAVELNTTENVENAAETVSEKTKLSAPERLGWGRNYTAYWNAVPDAQGYYKIEVLRDGNVINELGIIQEADDKGVVSWDLSIYINESGTYQFKVQASNAYDPEQTEASEWVSSPEKIYNRPDAQLDTTKGYWDTTKPGKLNFLSVKGAREYEFTVYKKSAEGAISKVYISIRHFGNIDISIAGQELSYDITRVIDRKGEGLYCVAIKALSDDLDSYRSSEMGEKSDFYDTTKTSSAVKNSLSNALSDNKTASEALNTVTSSVSKEELKTAMQTDPEALALVNELETKYKIEKGISVKDPEVSDAAAKYVDSGKIEMVGAGLNATAGSVQLSVGIPEKREYVSDKHYKNTVQLAIELKNDNTSVHELGVPITITMPIPTGLDESRLAILHYHEDGSVESVNLKNNGDGTVTFTVTSFSTFVFAEMTENESDQQESGGNSGSVSHDWNDITVNVDWAAVSSKLDSAVQAADGTNVNVLTGKDVKVSEDILNKTAGKNVTLALQAGNGVALSVSGQNNKQILGALDLTVTNKDTVPAQVKNTVMAGALSSNNILITENSPLQTRVSLHVGLAKEYAGKYANLYYYDAKSGQMKLVGIYQINKDGQSMFALTHGGQYIVTVTDAAAKGVTAEGYTIVSGDTMSRIAVKMGTTLRALEAANPQIADINKIRPGQVIKIQ